MKNIFFLKKLVIFYGLFLLIISNVYSQGVERWDIKTLNDSLSVKIEFKNIIYSNVKDLNLIQRPYNIKNNTSRLSFEFNVFLIKCKVLEYLKQDDGDYHLIVSDIKNPEFKMIVEIIMPKYGNKIYYKEFKHVRDFFNKLKRKIINYNFEITGVGFFDLIHNQKGKALNYLELHPVLSIKQIPD